MRKCKTCGITVTGRKKYCSACAKLRKAELSKLSNQRRRKRPGKTSVYDWDIPRKTIHPDIPITKIVGEANKQGLSYGKYCAAKVEVKLPAWIGG